MPPKKLRHDSSFARLSPEELAEVDDMLLTGSSYAQVKAWLAERDIECSQTSVAEYYQRHLAPQRHARMRSIAESLATAGKTDGALTDATLAVVRQTVMELALSPKVDSLAIQRLYSLVLRGEALEIARRKLDLLEAREEAMRSVLNNEEGELTLEEQINRARGIFGMPPIAPAAQ